MVGVLNVPTSTRDGLNLRVMTRVVTSYVHIQIGIKLLNTVQRTVIKPSYRVNTNSKTGGGGGASPFVMECSFQFYPRSTPVVFLACPNIIFVISVRGQFHDRLILYLYVMKNENFRTQMR